MKPVDTTNIIKAMDESPIRHTPTEIKLHKKSRLLVINFDDNSHFELPCEYLRVFSRAAEVRGLKVPVTGKENVCIESIEPQGQYAVLLKFDDGHDTAIFSWGTLYELGKNQEKNWLQYLSRLEETGYQRTQSQTGPKRIKILYFAYLAQKYRKETETFQLPEKVVDVTSLLAWLKRRSPRLAPLLEDKQVRVTVNKQFSESFTRIEDGDEVALVPTSPFPPVTKDL